MQGNELRKGTVIKIDNILWMCMSCEHRTPGNLRAFMQAKLRNIMDGTQKEFRFSSTEKLEQVDVFERKMQYLYADGQAFCFMDTESYEQVELSKELIGDAAVYLQPENIFTVLFHDQTPLMIRLPTTMDFQVVEADPEIKGATASASYKNATLSNGVSIQVPQFVKVGDVIRINIEEKTYQERVKR
ncbi:MAG: elongation factor P [Deltaproteobacteria bacterium]|nr:elongation factor P [Deltaproteobacteria bacterium]